MMLLSTHDLTQRSTYSFSALCTTISFQLTTSRRGRLHCFPESARPEPFNSRPHAEVDIPVTTILHGWTAFNSRPHAEVDCPVRKNCWKIQIFQLTTSRRGRRTGQGGVYRVSVLSTHDLTQRSTFVLGVAESRLTFQLTTSRRGRLVPEFAGPEDRYFQLTTSRRGRLLLHRLN